MALTLPSPEKMAVNFDSATSPPRAVFVFDLGRPHRDAFHSVVRRRLRATSFRILDAANGFHSDDGAAYGPTSTWPWVPWKHCKGTLGLGNCFWKCRCYWASNFRILLFLLLGLSDLLYHLGYYNFLEIFLCSMGQHFGPKNYKF